jgi:glycosyltransferase involved in cell wall biosynthesis
MHVAVASHHRLPVQGYGGTERIVTALARGLVALGHRVTLLAPPGTAIPGAALVPIPARTFKDPRFSLASYTPRDADVLHAHFLTPAVPSGPPFLQTLYGNLKSGERVPPRNVFLSANHARRNGSKVFVYAGLDPAEFHFKDRKEDYDFFIGRLHHAKGYHWAIEGAQRTGRRLILAGGWRPTFARGIKYVGEVDGAKKVELLANARCLWMPALWDEPFGLTNLEALFSGTPVLGTRRGALPEILTPEVGALCDTLDDMVEASKTIDSRDPARCRAHAERYFTHLVMAEEYVRYYRYLQKTGALPEGRPTPYTTV